MRLLYSLIGIMLQLISSRLILILVFSVTSVASSIVAATLAGLDGSLTYTHRFYFCRSSYIRKCGNFLSFYNQLKKFCAAFHFVLKCSQRPLRRRRMDVDGYQHFGLHS